MKPLIAVTYFVLLMTIVPNLLADNHRRLVSLGEAIENAKRILPGKIISAETIHDGNKDVHHIRMLTPQGKVKRFRFNSSNGQRVFGDRRYSGKQR